MTKFVDLRKQPWEGPTSQLAELQRRIAYENDYATSQFPLIACESGLHLWRLGDPICDRGLRFLIGVSDWSLNDLAFLDRLSEYVRRIPSAPWIDVFNLGCCRSQEDIRRFFPQIEEVVVTPVVGVWENGVWREAAAGWKGIRLMEDILGATAHQG